MGYTSSVETLISVPSDLGGSVRLHHEQECKLPDYEELNALRLISDFNHKHRGTSYNSVESVCELLEIIKLLQTNIFEVTKKMVERSDTYLPSWRVFRQKEFMLDTLDYMTTGQRRVPLYTWKALLHDEGGNTPNALLTDKSMIDADNKIREKLRRELSGGGNFLAYTDNCAIKQYIDMFLSKPDGIKELAWTLEVFLMIHDRPRNYRE